MNGDGSSSMLKPRGGGCAGATREEKESLEGNWGAAWLPKEEPAIRPEHGEDLVRVYPTQIILELSKA
ncbi:hypothetical protein RchiOBHm_Chr5g0066531 [Rosa chinensis]|uniref:Uncharacterized protein n=1 Tax=Rosa chinensis TaxID=74649 RepID=A0A2P6QJ91_ROSCH|nr:hypothetical protein RchiOBHm_Chr5g0066531 [Rosa chinensis]